MIISRFLLILACFYIAQCTVCKSSQLQLTIKITYATNAEKENVALWRGKANSGILIFFQNGNGYSSRGIQESMCVEKDIYTLVLSTIEKNMWDVNSRIQVVVENIIVLVDATLSSFTTREILIDCNMFLSPSSLWKYGDNQINNWNSPSFDDSSWEEGKQGFFSPIPLNSITRYYRLSFSLPSTISSFAGIRLLFNLKYGIVVYINGNEMGRYNMPDGPIQHHTLPLVTEEEYIERSLFYSSQDFTPSSTIHLAVEVHMSFYHAEMDDPFYSYLFFLPTENDGNYIYRVTDITTNDISVTSGMEKWIDGDMRTSQTLSRNYFIQFSFSYLAKALISGYSITLMNIDVCTLTAWRLDGSNNNLNWNVIDYREGANYFVNDQTVVIKLPTLSTAYVYYRFYFLESSTSVYSVSIADIQFFIKSSSFTQSVQLVYPSSSYSFLPGQSDIQIDPVMDGFVSFTLFPDTLLSGLTLSNHCGSISGTIPESATTQTQVYTVIGVHRNGESYSTQLQLSVSTCTGNWHLVQFTFTSYGGGASNYWQLLQNEYAMFTKKGKDSTDIIQSVYTVCLEEGDYQVQLFTTSQGGWTVGSSLQIRLLLSQEDVHDINNSVYYGSSTLYPPSRSLFIPLSFVFISDATQNGWLYYPYDDIPTDWKDDTSSATWWSVPSSSVQGSVWLFRKSFSLQSISSFQSIEFRFFSSPGIIIYINGQHVYSLNVPEGDLTATTVSTKTGDPYWHIFTIDKPASHIRTGSNSIAVAIVHPSSAMRPLQIKAVIFIHSESEILSPLNSQDYVDNSVSYNSNVHVANHEVVHLFDGNLLTYYSANWDSTTPPSIIIAFNENRQDLYNYYCVGSSATTSQRHDPLSWTIEVSNNGQQWTNHNTIQSTQFQRGERKCSFFPIIYSSNYRIRLQQPFSANPGSIDLASFSLLYSTSLQVVTTPLFYSQTTFTAFLNIPFNPSYSLNNEDYIYFTIYPALPSGLYIDSFSGLLFGKPTELASNQEYTITAKASPSVTTNAIIHLQVVECDGYEHVYSLLSIQLDNYWSTSSPYNYIQLNLHNKSQTLYHEQISDETPLSHDVSSQSYSRQFCLSSGHFYIQLVYAIETTTIPSYSISVPSRDILYEGSFNQSNHLVEFHINNEKIIHPVLSSWHVRFNSNQIPSNWFQSSLSFSWPERLPAEFEIPTTITSYYCTSFHASYSNDISGYLIGVHTRGGFAMYLNGIEINRIRLPEGELQPNLSPISELTESVYIPFAGSIQFNAFNTDDQAQVEGAPEGHNNLLCIENHQSVTAGQPNDFTVYLEYIYDASNRVLDGDPWGSVSPIQDPWYEFVENAFDGNPNTKYFGMSNCIDVIARWTYRNERKEYANHFTFYAGNSNNRRPVSLLLQGSNDLSSWTTLVAVNDLEWDNSGYGQKKEWTFSNTQSFASYQVVASGCISDGIEMAEIILLSKRVPVACQATEGFPAAEEGQESIGPCPMYHTGVAIRVCQNGHFSEIDMSQCIPVAPTPFTYTPSSVSVFTHTYFTMVPEIAFYYSTIYVKPSLPAGVTLNSTTGIISGTPYEKIDQTTFTVTALNSRGKSTSIINIVVASGCPDIGDFSSTPVGEEAIYHCTQNMWMYGKVKRLCEEREGVAVWGEPRGYCKNTVVLLIMVLLLLIIVFAVIATWCISESINRRMNVYQLPNGEIELEDIDEQAEAGEVGEVGEVLTDEEEIIEGEEMEDLEELVVPRGPTRRRPRKKLIGRPVFIYIPRYFHKPKKDYGREYHKIKSTPARAYRI